MKNRIYTSFEEIDRELEILKIEKEISYQKIILNGKQIGDFFSGKSILKNSFKTIGSLFTSSSFSIIKMLLPFLFQWYRNKKRSQ